MGFRGMGGERRAMPTAQPCPAAPRRCWSFSPSTSPAQKPRLTQRARTHLKECATCLLPMRLPNTGAGTPAAAPAACPSLPAAALPPAAGGASGPAPPPASAAATDCACLDAISCARWERGSGAATLKARLWGCAEDGVCMCRCANGPSPSILPSTRVPDPSQPPPPKSPR